MTIEASDVEKTHTPTRVPSVARSEDPLSLTPLEQARVAMEDDKRDRYDADFQVPTPRKRTAKDQGEAAGSSKRTKKGKGRAIDTPAHASSSRTTTTMPLGDRSEAERRIDLIKGITEIWKSDYPEWPIYDFAPVAARVNTRLEPDDWSLTLLEHVHSLTMIRPDEHPQVIRRALGQAIAQRNNSVAATAELNTMTVRDIEVAKEKLQDDLWLVTEFRESRSPTFVAGPTATGRRTSTRTCDYDNTEIIEELLGSVGNRTSHDKLMDTGTLGQDAESMPSALDTDDEDDFEEQMRSFMNMAGQYLQQKDHFRRTRATFERERAGLNEKKAEMKVLLNHFKA
ncbi:hypothetical protein AC578_8858 [Pseudocercospora eumusae]|uniref:Uncharacterized protein n=1 Tax=Pseudocercospora eumusae TaxID=321146 RepID=A0A139H5M7_9PEZI|nr:hypothetical protein AC578_8858 [Pseudocercospora eumusae]